MGSAAAMRTSRRAVEGRRTRRRVARWTVLLCVAGGSVLGGLCFLGVAPRERVSLSLAYVALAGLSVTLSLGALNLLRGRSNPVSFDLRRDLGIWTALTASAHTVVGLSVHFQGRMSWYFLAPPDQLLPGPIRLDAFGLANYAGLAAALLLLGLAGISSDRWLRRLGTTRWKRWQRLAYLAAGLTVLHGAVYQGLERRSIAGVALAAMTGAGAVAFQLAGIRQARRTGAR